MDDAYKCLEPQSDYAWARLVQTLKKGNTSFCSKVKKFTISSLPSPAADRWMTELALPGYATAYKQSTVVFEDAQLELYHSAMVQSAHSFGTLWPVSDEVKEFHDLTQESLTEHGHQADSSMLVFAGNNRRLLTCSVQPTRNFASAHKLLRPKEICVQWDGQWPSDTDHELDTAFSWLLCPMTDLQHPESLWYHGNKLWRWEPNTDNTAVMVSVDMVSLKKYPNGSQKTHDDLIKALANFSCHTETFHGVPTTAITHGIGEEEFKTLDAELQSYLHQNNKRLTLKMPADVKPCPVCKKK